MNNRFTRACFLLITSFEELAIAYFIMDNFNEPKPEMLKDLMYHKRKLSISSFLTFPLNANYVLLKKYINQFKNLNLKNFSLDQNTINDVYKTRWYKFGNEIQIAQNLMSLRNYCLYTCLNEDLSNFINPRNISKDIILGLTNQIYFILTIAIPMIQIQANKLFNSKNPNEEILRFKDEDNEILEIISNYYVILRLIEDKSIEKIKRSKKITKKLKSLALELIFNPEKEKEIEFTKKFIIELLKPLSLKLSELIKDEIKRREQNQLIEAVKFYNPAIGLMIERFFNFLICLSENNEEDFDKLIKEGLFTKS